MSQKKTHATKAWVSFLGEEIILYLCGGRVWLAFSSPHWRSSAFSRPPYFRLAFACSEPTPSLFQIRFLIKSKKEKVVLIPPFLFYWLRRKDLNQRPPGYEPGELPGCSTPRYVYRLSNKARYNAQKINCQ